ncbi:MAG: DUF559 domain-containing protein [bacterium]|nr:DUF559 domain-containing protein [bacterium]
MTGKSVLVAVLKSKDDLRLLLEEKWYRIPVAFLPKRTFTHIAFYEPLTGFGKSGKRILYYGRVVKKEVKKRIELLPNESSHPRARDSYLKCSFRKIEKLETPIRNVIPRRVSFGFTDLVTLRSVHDILELYHVAPTEQIVEQELQRLGIPVTSQYRIKLSSSHFSRSSSLPLSQHYRLDLAIFCREGKLAIECDNRKAHSGKLQKLKDKQKDLALKKLGWRVFRLTEYDILENLDSCISHIQKIISLLGGVFE